ncbi:OsmC family protein [Lentibacillus cibarius]|uniref:OsmC family protein n=1 Tax=Lentibacillus cibarius TaxID=2583219 RepID=A0A549YF86_9BACI|nr:OsmC family protein [Lentibacillus cibarius]TMN21661.1 OsmC family protein [Lentibacillus cibarius]TRM10544.1 OsmC family protein [Lentibacillus cibarius]
MAKTSFNVTANLHDGMQVKAKSRGFEVAIDEPKQLGGTDTGMNPVELILAGLGACQAITARTYANQFNIKLDDFWVELEGILDIDGMMHKADVRPGYSDISYNIHIQTDAPKDKVEEFIAFIEKTCPVGDTLANPVNVKLNDIVIETPIKS